MTKAVFIKRGGALYPVQVDGEGILTSMPDGRECMVNVHTPRNPRHHRLLFALLNTVCESGAWESGTESLLEYIKYGVGHVRTSKDPNGKLHVVPKSIAYESMAQDKFNRFFDRAVWLICEHLLDGHDWQSLRAEIYESVDGKAQRAA